MPQFSILGQPEFKVLYQSSEDGGGTWFGQEYVEIVRDRYQRRFRRCLEWCSGPGFIGFALLAHGLCDSLCLVDYNGQAAVSVGETARYNRCQERVQFYQTDRISVIPDVERFDLVVANPPHYLECPGDDNYQRIAVDTNWQAHQEFYQNIARYLDDDAVVLLQENQAGSLRGPAEWQNLIDRSGLETTAYWTSPRWYDRTGPTQIYYMETRLAKNRQNTCSC